MITRAETIIPITRVLNRSIDPFEPSKTFQLSYYMFFLNLDRSIFTAQSL